MDFPRWSPRAECCIAATDSKRQGYICEREIIYRATLAGAIVSAYIISLQRFAAAPPQTNHRAD
jgi:hypothetical protein